MANQIWYSSWGGATVLFSLIGSILCKVCYIRSTEAVVEEDQEITEFLCTFVSNCPRERIVSSLSKKSGFKFESDRTTFRTEDARITVSIVYTTNNPNMIEVRIVLSITNVQCHDFANYTCSAQIPGKTPSFIQTRVVTTRDFVKPEIIFTIPTNLNRVEENIEKIIVKCQGGIPKESKYQLGWMYFNEAGDMGLLPNKTYSQVGEMTLGSNPCVKIVESVLEVEPSFFKEIQDPQIRCAISFFQNGRMYLNERNYADTGPIKLVECNLTADWEKEESFEGGIAGAVCKWNNTCTSVQFGFTIQSNLTPIIATEHDARVARPAMVYTDLKATEGEITLTFTNFRSSDAQRLVCMLEYYSIPGKQAIASTEFKLKECKVSLTCTGSRVPNGQRATGQCQWETDCAGKAWYYTLSTSTGVFIRANASSPVGIYMPSERTSDDQPLAAAKHNPLSRKRGRIYYYVDKIFCDNDNTVTCTTYWESDANRSVSVAHMKLAADSFPREPTFTRSTPPLSMLKDGVKEHSLVTLTCLADLGTYEKARLKWLVITAHEERPPGLEEEVVEIAVDMGEKHSDCTIMRESTIYLTVSRNHHNFKLRCYIDVALQELQSPPPSRTLYNETYHISVHYGITSQTTTLMTSNPEPRIGDWVDLTCCAISYPNPYFYWLAQRSLGQEVMVLGKPTKTCNILTLRNVQVKDTGTYTCIAQSEHFSEVRKLTLKKSIIIMPPRPDHVYKNTTPEVTTQLKITYSPDQHIYIGFVMKVTLWVVLFLLVLLVIIGLLTPVREDTNTRRHIQEEQT